MFDAKIVCAFLYIITRYGYPPDVEFTEDHLDEMKALGFKSVELEGIREEHLLKVYDNRHKISAKIKALDLDVPYFCAVLPGLSSMVEAERNEQLALFEKGCEIAQLFGSRGILDNAPLPPYQFPADIPVVRHYGEEVLASAFLPKDISWDKFWDILTDTYRTACDIAAKYGLTYQMHPAQGLLSSTTDAFLYFHDAVGRDNLRFNLDTANQFVMQDNLALSLRRLKDHIDYIHISDNRGGRVEHLAIGEGKIRWDIFMETLHHIDFKGHIGMDIGGDESAVADLDAAYKQSAKWVEDNWLR
ncbi:MAG: sugar phosphate isomerase/epimerase [Emcibacter sp.]|nr:sugar phosphate isomerase/epimerase [Emcibacter sp.]